MATSAALDESELLSEVRNLTDYPSAVLSDADLKGLVDNAQRDIKAETGNYSIDWYNPDKLAGNRALMYATSLLAKIKAGEIDGVDLTMADLDVETLRAQGTENGDRPVFWYEQYRKFIERLYTDEQSRSGFGRRAIERSDRTYSQDTTQSGGL